MVPVAQQEGAVPLAQQEGAVLVAVAAVRLAQKEALSAPAPVDAEETLMVPVAPQEAVVRVAQLESAVLVGVAAMRVAQQEVLAPVAPEEALIAPVAQQEALVVAAQREMGRSASQQKLAEVARSVAQPEPASAVGRERAMVLASAVAVMGTRADLVQTAI